jgi:sedoheptulokinase
MDVPLAGIVLCSEQNGFVALDDQDRPLTNYVSWKDERSLEPVDGVDTYSLLVKELGEAFKQISGWRPGPGLPIMNATHMARLGHLPPHCKIVSLPEWLALCCDDGTGVVHDSMLHGLAFYDVHGKTASGELVAAVEALCGVRFTFNQVAPASAVAGYWHGAKGKVPIYAGVGDHQCSVLGACNQPTETISLNIGTGSQVGIVDPLTTPDASEVRPYFDGRILAAITRIPGGRVLSHFIAFLENVCRSMSSEPPDFWRLLQAVDEADVASATLDFDLAIFGSAWGFKGGGKIEGILEGSLTLQNYLASLLRSFVQQYIAVINHFDPIHQLGPCILSGGVARRLPVLGRLVADLSGYETLPATDLDESMLGLRTLALVATGQADTVLEAQRIFGRDCSLG